MPEGDTIYRTAATLRTTMQGRIVVNSECRADFAPIELTGHTVQRVEARGKHLLIHFDGELVLHSHMGMTGAWHRYQRGEPWKKPRRRAALTLTLPEAVVVCFSPKTLELLSQTALRRHRYLQKLGPDLLGNVLTVNELLPRFRIHNPTPIGEAVMNQTIVSGIGNVYKSEVLFLTRTNPFCPVAALSDAQLEAIVSTAQQLMQRNLDGYPRTTRFTLDRVRLWVYNRQGQPCFKCRTAIAMRRQGDLGRSTYYCANCQLPANVHASQRPRSRP